jgi:AmmeMemoRadiSam system protein B
MLRLPAVSGAFYPAEPQALTALINKYVSHGGESEKSRFRACLVPHAGYVYSGAVAGAVFSHIVFPKRVIVLGVRHFPYGEDAAMLSRGLWRTPLGDAAVDSDLAAKIAARCPLLREDTLAHENEHSLEVQIPFLQVLDPGFSFVPIALGTHGYEALVSIGRSLGQILAEEHDLLLLTTTDLNHYEDQSTTLRKDHLAVQKILEMDPRGLYEICRKEKISMCGLGPSVALLTALQHIGVKKAELVRHATSAEYSHDLRKVVGYAGFLFS